MPKGTSSAGSNFFSLPSTSLGKISTLMLATALALIVVIVVFFDAPNELGPPLLGRMLAVTVGVCLLVAMAVGLIAFVRHRERSWAVWLSVALPGVVLVFEVVEVLTAN